MTIYVNVGSDDPEVVAAALAALGGMGCIGAAYAGTVAERLAHRSAAFGSPLVRPWATLVRFFLWGPVMIITIFRESLKLLTLIFSILARNCEIL